MEPVAVGLPDLDQAVAQRRVGAVDDAAGDRDPLAARLVVDHRGAEVLAVDAGDLGEVRRQPDMNVGPGRLRGGFLEAIERLDHDVLPNDKFRDGDRS